MAKPRKTPFVKGHKYGKGRPPALPPQLAHAVKYNRDAFRARLLTYFSVPTSVLSNLDTSGLCILDGIIVEVLLKTKIEANGDMLKTLSELALGKLVTEPDEFPINEDEKRFVLHYRAMKLQRGQEDD